MDNRLKVAAVLAWTIALGLSFFADLDHGRWVTSLAVGFYAAGACLVVCVVMRSCARCTRQAVYHQRRWDDTPDTAVLHLLRSSDDQPRERIRH